MLTRRSHVERQLHVIVLCFRNNCRTANYCMVSGIGSFHADGMIWAANTFWYSDRLRGTLVSVVTVSVLVVWASAKYENDVMYMTTYTLAQSLRKDSAVRTGTGTLLAACLAPGCNRTVTSSKCLSRSHVLYFSACIPSRFDAAALELHATRLLDERHACTLACCMVLVAVGPVQWQCTRT